MATQAKGKRVAEEKVTVPKAKRGRKAGKQQVQDADVPETQQETSETVARPSTRGGKAKKPAPTPQTQPAVSVTEKTSPVPSPQPSPSIIKRPAKKAKLGIRLPLGKAKTTVPVAGTSTQSQETPLTESQKQVIDLKMQIRAILMKSEDDEREILKTTVKDEITDSEDEFSNGAQDNTQQTMEADQDYTQTDAIEVVEEGVEVVEEGVDTSVHIDDEETDAQRLDQSTSSTRLRTIVQDESIFDDPTKSHEDWWAEDTTREVTLCELWEETRCLYDFTDKSHQTEDRNTIMKRFSTILHVPPHIIETRMASLRNHYQRMHRCCKSGQEPEGNTDRQKEILRLLWFLRQHIKTSASLTSYKGRSPARKSVQQSTPQQKSTPKPTVPKGQKGQTSRQVEDAPLSNISQILDHSLTPMKEPPSLTASEKGDDSSDEFVTNSKHFGRNNRLNNPKAVDVSVRRSLRLSPPPTGVKKTVDTSKVNSSKARAKQDTPVRGKRQQETPVKVKSKEEEPVSSCADIAPLATEEVLEEIKKANTKKTNVKKAGKKGPSKVSQDAMEGDDGNDGVLPLTAAARKAVMAPVPRQEGKVDKVPDMKPDDKQKTVISAADRKKAMVSGSVSDSSTYEVSLDTPWHAQQGPAYRKAQELAKKKKKDDPLVTLMQEKAETMKHLTAGLDKLASRPMPSASVSSPEQLWADSLVPQIQRMPQEVRDNFMVHVMSIAFKAISGKWP